jgi:hypothetical protein
MAESFLQASLNDRKRDSSLTTQISQARTAQRVASCFGDRYRTCVQAGEQRRPGDTGKPHWELHPADAAQIHFGVGIGEPGATRSPADLCEAGAQGQSEVGTDPTFARPCLDSNHRMLPRGETKPRRCTLRSPGNEIVLGASQIEAGGMTNLRLTRIAVVSNRPPSRTQYDRFEPGGRAVKIPKGFSPATARRTRVCVRKFGGRGSLPAINKQQDQHLRGFQP